MLQHEVFEQHIKDLSNIYLTLTRIIEKKKESFHLLKANKKIPRSLRIKCELTTSPSYANHHNFIQLKEELQNEVSNFIENSSKIMERWAEINIQLLTHDRCTNILKKSLQILEGLSSFYADEISQPYWPSISRKNTTLFLLKIYLSNNYIDTEDLSDHFGLPLEEILNLGAKIIHDTSTDSEISHIVSSLNMSEFNTTDNLQREFVSEVLVNFNQIIKICTIDIWHFNKEKTRQTTAANNLKLKMKSIDTSTATVATARAISKATDAINIAQSTELKTNLRLSNLEKSFRKQESATNEIRNKIKRTPPKKLLWKPHSRANGISRHTGSDIQETKAETEICRSNNRPLAGRRSRDLYTKRKPSQETEKTTTISSKEKSAMGECGCPQFQHWTPCNNFEYTTFFLLNSINDPTFWSTPTFHTGTSTFHDSFPLSNSAYYTTKPSIQSSVWYPGTPWRLSEPNPTICSNAQSILYEPNPATATKALQGIPFREVTLHNRISTKTKIKSSNTKSSDTTKISKKQKKIMKNNTKKMQKTYKQNSK